ncbi:MAG: glycosyltransferase family 2 protein [Lachnospiraceae bacterium]|nr:glycosyltransferase family 2 protein [Lachnospiraceae bacterium]
MIPVLYIVIPCYNEQEVLPETSGRILKKLRGMMEAGLCSGDSRILFVDDGSRDNTWEMISGYAAGDEHFEGLKLAHNRGHQNALLCGLMTVNGHCDAVISMDADLQDDIEVLDQFMEKYLEGCEVVYGVRKARTTDTAFKRGTAQAYYKFMEILGTKVIYNHADYRLLGSRALDALSEYREVNLFLRGLVTDIGYKTDVVYYDRAERFAGESKYPLKKMLALAIQGITSFSTKPLDMIFTMGCWITVLSVLVLIYALVAALASLPGVFYACLFGGMFLCCGLILLSMGVLSCYVGKIYAETKARPRYRVEEWLRHEPDEKKGSAADPVSEK